MYPNNNTPILPQLTAALVPKRKVFVSYHHQDQVLVDFFRSTFGGVYDIFSDNSLDRLIDSTDTRYVNRTISEQHITGTSITIVLCGIDTWKRKYVDWEIYSTLDKDHALLGIVLPHATPVWRDGQLMRLVPDRLYTNIVSGYAHWIEWPQNPQTLSEAISHSLQRKALFKKMKNNSANKMVRNLP